MSQKTLAFECDVSPETVSRLCRNEFSRADMDCCGSICVRLRISFGDLFPIVIRDLWHPVRIAGDVAIHFPSHTAFLPSDLAAESPAGTARHPSSFVSSLDFAAFDELRRFLGALDGGRDVLARHHLADLPHDGSPLAALLREGRHPFVLGSPLASQLSEELLCELLGIDANRPSEREKLPFWLRWDPERPQTSSLGEPSPDGHLGVWSRNEGRLVTRRTYAAPGESGEDTGFLVSYRAPVPPRDREDAADDSRLVVCCAGLGGVGTLGAVRLATDLEHALALFPSEIGCARMAVFSVKYNRRRGPYEIDDRRITSVELYAVTDVPRRNPTTPPRSAAAGKAPPVPRRRPSRARSSAVTPPRGKAATK